MIDIITIHPRALDYPIWRKQLHDYRSCYNKAIVAFEGIGEFEPFVTEQVDAEFVDTFIGEGEWRDIAVNRALDKSSSEWVWFLEQDFFWKSKKFINTLLSGTKTHDAIGFWEAQRLHPACLLIKRDLINRTPRDFSPQPDVLDHFGKFSQSVVSLGAKIAELRDLGLEPMRDWYHMQGLTHNYNLCRSNDLDKVFKKDEFLTYNAISPKIKIPQSPLFHTLSNIVSASLVEYSQVSWLKKFWEGSYDA